MDLSFPFLSTIHKHYIHSNNCLRFSLFSTFINSGNKRGEDKVLPVWRSVWIGPVQPEYRIPTLPPGSVQEATRRAGNTGGHEGLEQCWKVSILLIINSNLWFYIVLLKCYDRL